MNSFDQSTKSDGWLEKLIAVRRTVKVKKGGRRFSFSAITVVGNGKGKIGVGKASAGEVPDAIRKSLESARRNIIEVMLHGKTLFHSTHAQHGASIVMMQPAPEGTGIIAGGAMRGIFEVVGVHNVSAKCLGSTNPVNVVWATLKGLQSISSPQAIADKRGKPLSHILGENIILEETGEQNAS